MEIQNRMYVKPVAERKIPDATGEVIPPEGAWASRHDEYIIRRITAGELREVEPPAPAEAAPAKSGRRAKSDEGDAGQAENA